MFPTTDPHRRWLVLLSAAAVLVCPAGPGAAQVPERGAPPEAQLLSYDDGTDENRVGVLDQPMSRNVQAVYLNAFDPTPEQFPVTLTNVAMLFPRRGDVTAGMAFDVLVYVDESGSGDPLNAVLVRRQRIAAQPSDTIFQTVDLDPPVEMASGNLYVGFTDAVSAKTNHIIRPAAVDEDAVSGRSLIASSFAGFDGDDLRTADNGIRVLSRGAFMIRAFYTTGGAVQLCWDPPADGVSAPENVRVCTTQDGAAKDAAARRGGGGFNVYRSRNPNVEPTPENLVSTTGPQTTTVRSGVAPGGSFFVVTTVSGAGESGPSNEVAAVPPVIQSVKVRPAKIVARGSGFAPGVVVFVDGIPFAATAKVKGTTKVVQKGQLLNGMTIGAYLSARGNRARVAYRNADGTLVNFEVGR